MKRVMCFGMRLVCVSDTSVCNDRQRWNSDKCRCECKELTGEDKCDDGFTWIPSACECECRKSCNDDEYLDYLNWKCKSRLINSLFEKCDKDIDGNKMVYNATLHDYGRVCRSCTL